MKPSNPLETLFITASGLILLFCLTLTGRYFYEHHWPMPIFWVCSLILLAILFYFIRKLIKQQQTLNRQLMELQQGKQFSEQRYRSIAKLSDDVMFEFDLIHNTLSDSTNWDLTCDGDRFIDGSIAHQVVHPDDVSIFIDYFRGKHVSGAVQEQEIRLRSHLSPDYHWTLMRAIVLGDTNGIPEKLIGRRLNIDKLKREKEIYREQAQKDLMTGLYNKETAESKIRSRLMERSQDIHILFVIDIDEFKNINDTYGHAAGDDILKEFAQSLLHMIDEPSIIGRAGGDEFVILMEQNPTGSTDDIATLAEQILTAIQSLPSRDKLQFIPTCSIGIACFPQDGQSYEDLFEHADKALYNAKKRNRNCFMFS